MLWNVCSEKPVFVSTFLPFCPVSYWSQLVYGCVRVETRFYLFRRMGSLRSSHGRDPIETFGRRQIFPIAFFQVWPRWSLTINRIGRDYLSSHSEILRNPGQSLVATLQSRPRWPLTIIRVGHNKFYWHWETYRWTVWRFSMNITQFSCGFKTEIDIRRQNGRTFQKVNVLFYTRKLVFYTRPTDDIRSFRR